MATYRLNNSSTLALGGSMVTGEMTKEITLNYSPSPGTYNPAYEKMTTLRAGTMYGGVIHKGQSFFAGHNSEKRLHTIQNWIHRGELKRTIGIGPSSTPYFYDWQQKSRGYGYYGGYNSNYLYY